MLTSQPVNLFLKETLPTEPKKGPRAPPPRPRDLDPPNSHFLTQWRWSSLHCNSFPHPPSALSAAASLPPGLLHLGLRHHRPLRHQLSSGTGEILGQAPPPLATVPWPQAGCRQALLPPRSRREAWPVMPLLPPSLLPFSVGLSSLILPASNAPPASCPN